MSVKACRESCPKGKRWTEKNREAKAKVETQNEKRYYRHGGTVLVIPDLGRLECQEFESNLGYTAEQNDGLEFGG